MKLVFWLFLFFLSQAAYAGSLSGSGVAETLVYFLAIVVFLVLRLAFTFVYRARLKKKGREFKWGRYLFYLLITLIISVVLALVLLMPFVFFLIWLWS